MLKEGPLYAITILPWTIGIMDRFFFLSWSHHTDPQEFNWALCSLISGLPAIGIWDQRGPNFAYCVAAKKPASCRSRFSPGSQASVCVVKKQIACVAARVHITCSPDKDHSFCIHPYLYLYCVYRILYPYQISISYHIALEIFVKNHMLFFNR